MAQLTVDYITSLDGYGSAQDWPGFWGMAGPEYLEFLAADADPDTALLMGANTYRLFAELVRAGQEGLSSMEAPRKIVFSKTLTGPLVWDNAELVTGDAVEAVRRLKEEDTPLVTTGSATLATALLNAGLVHRYRVEVGSPIEFVDDDGDVQIIGTVLEYEPPVRLAHTFIATWYGQEDDQGSLHWEIEPAAGGCRITLVHRGARAETREGSETADGSRQLIDALKAVLEGAAA